MRKKGSWLERKEEEEEDEDGFLWVETRCALLCVCVWFIKGWLPGGFQNGLGKEGRKGEEDFKWWRVGACRAVGAAVGPGDRCGCAGPGCFFFGQGLAVGRDSHAGPGTLRTAGWVGGLPSGQPMWGAGPTCLPVGMAVWESGQCETYTWPWWMPVPVCVERVSRKINFA